jgi:hypothetical protein
MDELLDVSGKQFRQKLAGSWISLAELSTLPDARLPVQSSRTNEGVTSGIELLAGCILLCVYPKRTLLT